MLRTVLALLTGLGLGWVYARWYEKGVRQEYEWDKRFREHALRQHRYRTKGRTAGR